MKASQRILVTVALLLATYLLTRWWLATPYSETAWSWINANVEGGQNPSLASDIELLAALLASFGVAMTGFYLLRLFALRITQRRDARGPQD